MNNNWIRVGIEIDNSTLGFTQIINVSDMISTEYTRLLDESILGNYKKALKACNGKFDMITISISRSVSYSYTYQCLQQYRFLGKKSTDYNPGGIEGCRYYDNMFGDFQPCNKKEIVQTIKEYINTANRLYIEAIKENNQQLVNN
jgi:hypothetical protein